MKSFVASRVSQFIIYLPPNNRSLKSTPAIVAVSKLPPWLNQISTVENMEGLSHNRKSESENCGLTYCVTSAENAH